ncbi:MAG: hypothetical protein ACJ8IK_14260 [Burkholderiaceae bacterium]
MDALFDGEERQGRRDAEGTMMNELLTPNQEILRNRIRFALRRATGFVFDIEAMLRKPELRAKRIGLWRNVADHELSSLLDQLETEFQADAADEEEEAERTVVIRRPEAGAAHR